MKIHLTKTNLLKMRLFFLLQSLLIVIFPTTVLAKAIIIMGLTIYPSPDVEPIKDASIVIENGIIKEIIPQGQKFAFPKNSRIYNLSGKYATAGLWNSHVHLTDPKFSNSNDIQKLLNDMFLQYGFTSVVDTGSDLLQSMEIRTEILKGTILGPNLMFASGSFVYKEGTPIYLPKEMLPEVTTVEMAAPMVRSILEQGAEGIKIFSGSFQGANPPILIPPEIIRAITKTAHDYGAFVYSHPTSLEGFQNAISNGVDILAHTAPDAGQLPNTVYLSMADKGMAITPTLKLWTYEVLNAGGSIEAASSHQTIGITQLRKMHSAGIEILFGTDVGYMADFDPLEEYLAMEKAGMSFNEILRTLTTNPANRFKKNVGKIEQGLPADITIYNSNPAEDLNAMTDIEMTIKSGKIIYENNNK